MQKALGLGQAGWGVGLFLDKAFSIKKGDKKEIYNQEVIDEIKKEIERLRKL